MRLIFMVRTKIYTEQNAGIVSLIISKQSFLSHVIGQLVNFYVMVTMLSRLFHASDIELAFTQGWDIFAQDQTKLNFVTHL